MAALTDAGGITAGATIHVAIEVGAGPTLLAAADAGGICKKWIKKCSTDIFI